jgi:outer membrane protein TolC
VLGLNYWLILGFNIVDGFNRNRQQQNAKITIENKTLEIENLELSLKSDFSNIWKAYQNNMELTLLEKENLQNAKVNYEIAIDRYKLGNLSGVELREAQNSLLDAEERLIEAQLNTKLSEITLLQLSGRLNILVN